MTCVERRHARQSGKGLEFRLDRGEGPAHFCMSVRKSGSTLLLEAVTGLAEACGRQVVNIADAYFEAGLAYEDWNTEEELAPLLARGNIYAGFRDAPSAALGQPVFEEARKMLLVRDPRDLLVSEYFSNAYSHRLPRDKAEGSVIAREREKARAMSLDAYVLLRSRALNRTMEFYRPLIGRSDLRLFRYEEIIFEKRRWLEELAGFLGLDVPAAAISALLARIDLRPEAEDPQRFVRRVTPGDHRRKLAPATIEQLGDALSDVWSELGYDMEPSMP